MHFARDREIMVSFGTDMHSTAGAVEREKIKPVYSGDSRRPAKYEVEYKIDGKKKIRNFENGGS